MQNRLIIDIEDKYSGDLWRGDYSVKFVEELTNKTGTFKKFNVFVKMILGAVKNQQMDQGIENVDPGNNVVSIALLTQQDLMELKNKKAGTSGGPSSSSNILNGGSQGQALENRFDKKYLILTFDAEFEKVHYPLPLNYQEEPDMQSMFKTFSRLSEFARQNMNMTARSVLQNGGQGSELMMPSDLLAQKIEMEENANGMNRYNTMQDFFRIELENDELRSELHEVQSTFTATDQKLLDVQQEKVYAETEYDNYRSEA
jgi:coiled-coil domain-containing protein 61